MNDKRCELLSPAGNYECFIAAIKAGADAVYAGGTRFGARAYADNFTQEELIRALDHAHLRNKKLYLTVNTVLKNPEIDELYDYILPLYEQGLDGVIVQDMGVISLLRKCFPGLDLHASTQMAITGAEGVQLLKDLGISRVVPARELSLEEIRHIYDLTGMELECFIHGAMCYSYSGKCLFSSLAGGRSGNRGRCAGPCRLPYDGKYMLSLRDICTVELLPDLIEAGIASFKIEGRMKSKEYVAGVTGIYRKYIDIYYEKGRKGYSVERQDQDELTGIYTRSGHCQGYYYERNGADMVTLDRPSYETAEDDKQKVLFKKYTAADDRPAMNGILTAFKDEKLTLMIDCGGYEVSCEGDTVEAARNTPTDEENIMKHLKKTGESDFVFDLITVYAGEDIFVPVSSINNLRRSAIAMLREEMLKGYRRSAGDKREAIEEKSTETGCERKRRDSKQRRFHCRIDNLKMLSAICEYDFIDMISVDISEFITKDKNTGRQNVDRVKLLKCAQKIHFCGFDFAVVLPPVIRDDYFTRYGGIAELLREAEVESVIIDNYESLYYLKNAGYEGKIVSDIHLYAMNDAAVSAFHGCGVTVITCPAELNRRELEGLDMCNGEFMLYGRLPMMISAGCTEKTLRGCIHDNGTSVITDRLGNDFPVQRNCKECFNTILNCVPLMIPWNKTPDSMNINSYRIHFTVEDDAQIRKVMDYYRECAEGKDLPLPDIKHTLSHYRRGVE